jgi:hypothetical protein
MMIGELVGQSLKVRWINPPRRAASPMTECTAVGPSEFFRLGWISCSQLEGKRRAPE